MAWSDIGSWESLWEIHDKDENGNATAQGPSGRVITVGTKNSLIHANDKTVACIGLDDLVVIETRDSILIANKRGSDGIKTIVNNLQKENAPEVLRSPARSHAWGHSQVMSEGPGFRMKEMVLKPGGSRSLKMHHHRTEQWVIVSGEGLVTIDGVERAVKAQDSIVIPARAMHQLVNTGTDDLRVYEFQYGSLIEDGDVVRFNDPETRKPTAAGPSTAGSDQEINQRKKA